MPNPMEERRGPKEEPSGLSADQFREMMAALTAAIASGKGSDQTSVALNNAITQLKEQVERTVTRSNKINPGISVFDYPEGRVAAEAAGKVKKLKYKTYFCGGPQREDDLTPTEVDLYNQFTGSKTARDGAWSAEVRRNGSTLELHVNVPCFTNDERMNLPALTAILGELLYGTDVVDPTMTMAKILAMQKQIDELTAAQAAR